MTEREFLNAVGSGDQDVVQLFLDAVTALGISYCAIGGLAVNAYAEPVVSLDLDVVVAAHGVDALCMALQTSFSVERFEHSVNLTMTSSALRLQIQTDPRYEAFVGRASTRTVLGYEMKVAALEDVVQGKVWAYLDVERRNSKRQKDLADLARLVEAHPGLVGLLPEVIRERLR